MSWREFEMLVGEGFRLQGYQVMETGGGGPDGGIDLVLRKPGQNGSDKFLVQCKQWRAYKVGVDVVRELYGVMAAQATKHKAVEHQRLSGSGGHQDGRRFALWAPFLAVNLSIQRGAASRRSGRRDTKAGSSINA